MNDFKQLLTSYNNLVKQCRTMIEKEMEHLKSSGQLDDTILESKQKLVQEFDSKLQELIKFRQTSIGVPLDLKPELDEVQHKFMQVIKLDRELEKIYLSQQHKNAERVDQANWVDKANARRTYGML